MPRCVPKCALQAQLPIAYETRNIEVAGFVRGLPSIGADGTRFMFEVESNDARLRDFPRVVQLSWLAVDDAPPPPALQAGQRWSLTVRLKRPHGNANFGARDAEAALLARNIRATGYVTAASSARRLARDAFGITLAIDRWRAHLRDRIERVLADAPHRGIVVALAIGAQDGVSDDDWSLMRATGTSHLVAISGLHIGFVAGLAALLSGLRLASSAMARRAVAAVRLGAKSICGWCCGVRGLLCGARGFQRARAARVVDAVFRRARVGQRATARRRRWCWRGRWRWCCSPIRGRSRRPDSGCRSARWRRSCMRWRRTGGTHRSGATTAASLTRDPVPYDSAVRVREPVPQSADRLRAIFHRKARRLHGRLASSGRVQYAVTISLAPLTAYWFSQIPLIGPLANAIRDSLGESARHADGARGRPAARAARRLRLSGRARPACHACATRLRWLSWPRMDAVAPAAARRVCAGCGGSRRRVGARAAWLAAAFRRAADMAAADAARAQRAHTGHVPSDGAGYRAGLVDRGRNQRTTPCFSTPVPDPNRRMRASGIVVPYLLAAGTVTLDTLSSAIPIPITRAARRLYCEAIEVRQLLGVAAAARTRCGRQPASDHGSASLRCAAGQRWQWDGVEFAMLWPDAGPLAAKPNATSCVLKVSERSRRRSGAPAAADIEADAERAALLRRGRRPRSRRVAKRTVLIVPHHGSKTSSTEPFLDSVEPLVAVFQVGYRNRFHHPNPTVFRALPTARVSNSRAATRTARRASKCSVVDRRIERYRQTHARYWMER